MNSSRIGGSGRNRRFFGGLQMVERIVALTEDPTP